VTDGEGSLLSGEPLEEAARGLLPLGPVAIGVNCVSSRTIGREVERLAAAAPGFPISAYANTLSDGISPEEYGRLAAGWMRSGARVVGGCCGTTPEHIAALRS
jgi:S-methylmethionine-dependent homocysteine/selenocysteine methylase